ncbi:MAG: caspase family protein [Candidatus Bathyarchaeota archaeon]|nr:MAG: caspase family protein [Candidatus Bathyarchaeota archaeon]
MQRRALFSILVLIIIGIAPPVIASGSHPNIRFTLDGKVKQLRPDPGDSITRPLGPPLTIYIIYPEDGATLSQGTFTVLVSAYAKTGVSSVELKIDGPEPVGWIDITGNFDGTYYTFDWTVTIDGTHTLTARVVDSRGKTKTDSNTVYIGAPQPDRWAVIIGIADYQGRDSDLWHPDEDAKEMEQELLAFGYPSENIRMLLNRKATAQAIANAVDWLVANEKAGDEVVFFYSGHGFRAPDEDGWDDDIEADGQDEMIVTHDFYGLPDGWFRLKFSGIESTKFALMFGSCHSGGMFDDNDDLQGEGRVIASACKADQYGWDYLQLGNTLWGYYFVDEGLHDDNANSVETAHEYAYPRVVAQQPDSQPQLYDNFSGTFEL